MKYKKYAARLPDSIPLPAQSADDSLIPKQETVLLLEKVDTDYL